jgi:hypothetical protein
MHGQVKKNKKHPRDLGRRQRHHEDRREVERLVESLNHVRLVAWRALTPGTVVQAQVPYTDGERHKVRPALVLGHSGEQVSVRPITTKAGYARRRGGGVEVWLNGRRCWVVNETIELDRNQIVQVTAHRYDELAFATAA